MRPDYTANVTVLLRFRPFPDKLLRNYAGINLLLPDRTTVGFIPSPQSGLRRISTPGKSQKRAGLISGPHAFGLSIHLPCRQSIAPLRSFYFMTGYPAQLLGMTLRPADYCRSYARYDYGAPDGCSKYAHLDTTLLDQIRQYCDI